MTDMFENSRNYQPSDPEIIEVLGPEPTQAQKRHHGTSPVYYRFGRKIIYRGHDLNDWVQHHRHARGDARPDNAPA